VDPSTAQVDGQIQLGGHDLADVEPSGNLIWYCHNGLRAIDATTGTEALGPVDGVPSDESYEYCAEIVADGDGGVWVLQHPDRVFHVGPDGSLVGLGFVPFGQPLNQVTFDSATDALWVMNYEDLRAFVLQARDAGPTVSTSPAQDTIELPPLPASGFAAMWSRDEGTGVSFVGLDGEVLATVPDATIYEPGGPPGVVVLVRGEDEFLLLDAEDHVLRSISKAEADEIVASVPSGLLNPSRSVGEWAWVRSSPDGTDVIGQYWQNGYGSQLSECSKPIAMISTSEDAEPRAITGQPLGQVQPTYALGWTPSGLPIAAVTLGPCGSPLD
jgi:hypothetical protein